MNTSLSPTASNLTTSATEQVLIEIWKQALSADRLTIHDNFFERGGNALLALQAILKINKIFGRHLSLSTIFDYPTIESFSAALASKKYLQTRSLVQIKKGGNKIPLYIIGYIGGSVDRFCDFAYRLDGDQPVYGLQTPLDLEYFNKEGFDMEATAVGYIQNEASHYVSLLLAQNPDGPFALAGYSFGGFIAREMAKQLQAAGKRAALLALLDTVIPGTIKSLPPVPEDTRLKGLSKINYQRKLLNQEFRITVYDNLFHLKMDSRKWVQKKISLVQQFFAGRRPTKAKAEMSARAKELTKARKALAIAAKNVYPLEYYDGEIVLFRARKRSSYYVYDRFLGWRPYCKSIKVYNVDGDHVSIFNPFYSQRLAARLQQVLDECQTKERSAAPGANVLFGLKKKTGNKALKK